MLCDTQHQKDHFPECYRTKESWLQVFTEKKVEVWHSKQHSNISPSDPAEVITQKAKVVSCATFHHHFVPDYQRGHSEKDHTLLAGETAQYLIQKFQVISTNLNKIKQVIK